MSFFVAIVGLLVLVAIHELGHFTAAKATGMRALRFYLGFPPAVVKRTWRGTEYGIGAIPLGGFVKIPGMLRPESGDIYDVEDILGRAKDLDADLAERLAAELADLRQASTRAATTTPATRSCGSRWRSPRRGPRSAPPRFGA